MEARQRRLLERRRKLLITRMTRLTDFVRGSVVLMKRRCTYPRCRPCASGRRHPTWVLTYSHHGKTRTVYLGQQRLRDAQRMANQYRTLTDLIEQIAQINLALLTGKDLYEEDRPHGRRPSKRKATT